MLQSAVHWTHKDRPNEVLIEYNAADSTAHKSFLSYLERYGHNLLQVDIVETFDPVRILAPATAPSKTFHTMIEPQKSLGTSNQLIVVGILAAVLLLS